MVIRKILGSAAFFFGSSPEAADNDVRQRMSSVKNAFTVTQRSTIEPSVGAVSLIHWRSFCIASL